MIDRLVRNARTAYDRIREDVRTARENDPAAKTNAEVLLYAGVHALWIHRIASRVYDRGFRLTGRALAQFGRFLTGVEIHPDADVGRRVFVDHGMGVVIGETAEIGDDVLMYHGVTLGGNDPRPVKRHPTVEDGVTLGARATLVGDITVGEGATVGAGAVVVEDVSPRATVAGAPAEPIDEDVDPLAGKSDAVDRRADEFLRGRGAAGEADSSPGREGECC